MNKELLSEFNNYVAKNIIPNFSQENLSNFEIYFDELIDWNKKFNLISFKAESDIIYRHFCDCLYSAKTILDLSKDKNIKVVDLGTGSGMPGIIVKIALPYIKMTLVESITKKCSFLENVNSKLNFDMNVLNKRAEEIGQNVNYRQHFDFVLSRAVTKFSPNLEIAIPLLKVGGYFMVHKTKNSIESKEEGLSSITNALNLLGAKLEKIIPYRLPNQELDYCLLVFKKEKETRKEFPRKVGVPAKKPL